MAFRSGASSPPFGEPNKQKAANRSPTRADQSANVGRFRSNVSKGYGVSGETGKSSRMPTGRATAPLVLGRGAKR